MEKQRRLDALTAVKLQAAGCVHSDCTQVIAWGLRAGCRRVIHAARAGPC